ncbi:MAG: flagellar hook assembly protein FlgD, partial [Pseudomonas sp.]|nr:flagellar hook assembly protein FlgD [Pseudomonas sp.]
MAAVSNNSQNNPAYSIDEAVKQSVNVSDATQLENNFLTLMVAQIQNQDPTKPVDSTEFLNQFAAMSQVKSLENMASLSKSNLVLLDTLQTLTAAGLVGQE